MMDQSSIADLELTKRCAAAMGIRLFDCGHGLEIMTGSVSSGLIWKPLHDNAQVLQMGLRFPEEFERAVTDWCAALRRGDGCNLHRTVCTRIAKLAAPSGGVAS